MDKFLNKKEERVIISTKLNTIFSKATKIFEGESVEETVKKKTAISNLEKIFGYLQKDQILKELHFFMEVKIENLMKNVINLTKLYLRQQNICFKETRCQSILKRGIFF